MSKLALVVFAVFISDLVCAQDYRGYVYKRIKATCESESSKSISAANLMEMVQNSKSTSGCVVYRTNEFANPESANVTTYDQYNGRIFGIQIVYDQGPRVRIFAYSLLFRDIPLCVLEQGNKMTIAYTLNSREPDAYENQLASRAYNGLRSTFRLKVQAYMKRVTILEFVDGNLAFAAEFTTDSDGKTAISESYFCGSPQFQNR